MNKRQLKTAIQQLRDTERHIQPDAAWVMRTRNQFLKTIRHDAIKRPVMGMGERFRAFVLAYVPRTTVDLIRGPVMAVVSVFAVVLGGSLASVSAAERSIPGDLLYPVKLATEQARILMEPESPNQLRLKAEFAERRGQEIKKLTQGEPSAKQNQQIKETADSLKKDLDAVKSQLHTVASESTASQAATLAKDVDERTGRVASTIKDLKESVSLDIRQNVVDVQVAAANTSLKAVQVLIETHSDPAARQVVSTDDIKRAVAERVQVLEDGITDTAKKVADVTAFNLTVSTTASLLPPSVSATIAAASSSEFILQSVSQLEAAKVSLEETKVLLQGDKLQDIQGKLGEAVQAIASAEKSVASALPKVVAGAEGESLAAPSDPAASTTVPTATSTVASTSSSTTSTVPTNR